MLQGSTRRYLAGLLLAVVATTLAACGMAPVPVAPYTVSSGSGIYARRAAQPVTRRYGMVFDRQTPRVRWVPGTVNAGLPAKVDLRSKLSPVDDQGDLGACTGFAIAGLAEYRALQRRQRIELSPGFIYLLELKEEGNLGNDYGARISTGMKVLQRHGIAPEVLHPYITPADQKDGDKIVQYLSTLPTPAAMKAAQPYRVKSIQPVNDLIDFKRSIASGKPVVFGIACYSSFEDPETKQTGIVPVPDPDTDGFIGGHAILAVGYDDTKQHVIFRNSYSPAWGDKGYGYLPYGYFKQELVGDAWQAS